MNAHITKPTTIYALDRRYYVKSPKTGMYELLEERDTKWPLWITIAGIAALYAAGYVFVAWLLMA